MSGETNLTALLKNMKPVLNSGVYVFVSLPSGHKVSKEAIVLEFREEEGVTLILKKETADELELTYPFVAAWITLKIHSSLEAVGLTAAVSAQLTKHNISCNIVAAFYHDHLFVHDKDAKKALHALEELSAEQL